MTLRELEKRLEKEPDNLPLRVTVAGMMREAGRTPEAVELYRSVALAYRDQGRTQQAVAVCKSILELAPDDTAIHALLAELAPRGRTPSGVQQTVDDLQIDTPATPTGESKRSPPTAPPIGRTPTGESGRMPPVGRTPTGESGRMPPVARTPTGETPKPEPIGRRPPTAQPTSRATSQAEPTVPRPASPSGPPRTPSQAEDTVTRPPTQQPVGKSTPSSGLKPLVPSPAGSGSRPPVSVAKRAAILTPATGSPSRPSPGPKRRSSFEETPLPRPVPHHVHDPTTSANKVPREEVADHLPHAEGDPTRPGGERDDQPDMTGLAQAARRISGLINPDLLNVDVAAELDTRQRPRLEPKDLDKISQPPPTVPVEMIDEHDLPTPPPATGPSPWGRPATHPAVPIRDTPRDPPTDLNAIAEGVRTRDTDEELTAPRDLVAADPLMNAFFLPLPANRREAALVRCVRRPARAGTTVIRQGETSHALILVVTGRLELRVERPNGTLAMLDTIDAGQYIGEAALLGRTPATANVIAATDCELLALPPHALFELAGAYPALWAALKDSAEKRTRQYDKLIRAST